MAKNIETVAAFTRAPTEQQAMLIKLASRKDGVTRAEVREALGYDESANIPVQSMLKNIAARFGYAFSNELFEVEGSARKIAFYTMREPAPVKAPKAKKGAAPVAVIATKMAAPVKKAAAVIVTAAKPGRKAARVSA